MGCAHPEPRYGLMRIHYAGLIRRFHARDLNFPYTGDTRKASIAFYEPVQQGEARRRLIDDLRRRVQTRAAVALGE